MTGDYQVRTSYKELRFWRRNRILRCVIPVVLLIQVKVCTLLYVPSNTTNFSVGSYHRIVYISEYTKNQLHVSALIRGHLQVVHYNSW
jgi:uncharacterized membrane protein YfhO